MAASRAENQLFLGIDGGGSSTAAVVIDGAGRVVSQGKGGPANSFHNSQERVLESVEEAVNGALDGRPGPVSAAASGTSGFEVTRFYLESRLPGTTIYWVGERQIGFASAGIFEEHGLVIIAGTGSSFLAVRRTGEQRFLGGWGSLLGDEGSAYDMAIRGIKLALRGLDGRMPRTDLLVRLQRFFSPREDPVVYVRATDIARLAREQIAAFAAEVSAAASGGDPLARGVVRDVAASLATDGAFAASQLFESEDAFPVVLSGGVFRAGPLLIDEFRNIFLARFPNATIIHPEIPPAQGAAELARHRFQTQEGPET